MYTISKNFHTPFLHRPFKIHESENNQTEDHDDLTERVIKMEKSLEKVIASCKTNSDQQKDLLSRVKLLQTVVGDGKVDNSGKK